MPSYFRQVPNFDYVSRLPNANIGDYIPVKNIFKKGKLREDIFQDLILNPLGLKGLNIGKVIDLYYTDED